MNPLPLLYPLLLILFAEGSNCKIVSSSAKYLLYGYLLTLCTTSYITDYNTSIVFSIAIYTFVFISCYNLSQELIAHILCISVWLFIIVVHINIYIGYIYLDFSIFGISLMQHSNYVIREGTIGILFTTSIIKDENKLLGMGILGLYLCEYFV